MEASYYSVCPDFIAGPDAVSVSSYSNDQGWLRLEQTQLCSGSIAQVKQELKQPAIFLEVSHDCAGIIWMENERAFQVWSAARPSKLVGEGRIWTNFRPCIRIESERIEVFHVRRRTRTLARRDIDAVVSWSRCDQAIGGVSLIPVERRRVKICSAYNWIAIELLTDIAPNLWFESWEGLQWTATLGSALAKHLGVSWIDEVQRE